MKTKKALRYLLHFLVVTVCLAAAGNLTCQSEVPIATQVKEQGDDAAGFQEFSHRVQDYVKLHKKVESKLPALKTTDLPEMIAAHQQALARKIREARLGARTGDVFTRSACEAFRHAIREVFESSPPDKARIPLGRTDPARAIHLQVNGVYPDAVPYTAVSPALLAKFPKLPDEVEYRVVVRDIALVDVKSNMVVDLAHDVIPSKP